MKMPTQMQHANETHFTLDLTHKCKITKPVAFNKQALDCVYFQNDW